MISLWCTGESAYKINILDALEIREKTISIGINFFNRFEPDYRIWLDQAVADWLSERLTKGEKIAPSLVTSQYGLFGHHELGHCFVVPCNGELGGFTTTLPTACRFIRDKWNDEEVYVFGADFTDYDHCVYVDGDVKRIPPISNFLNGEPLQKHSFNQALIGLNELHKEKPFTKWYNCSPESKITVWPKVDYKEVLL